MPAGWAVHTQDDNHMVTYAMSLKCLSPCALLGCGGDGASLQGQRSAASARAAVLPERRGRRRRRTHLGARRHAGCCHEDHPLGRCHLHDARRLPGDGGARLVGQRAGCGRGFQHHT
jgi:hypothetical protein